MRSVHIEPIDLAFAPEIQALAEDPAIGATSNVPSPYPPDGAATWIRQTLRLQAKGRERNFVLFAAGRVVGCCGLAGIGGKPRTAELGYWIGKPFWGRSYATQAARLVTDHAFREARVELLTSCCLLTNRASYRVLEKLGFRFLREAEHPHPKWGPEDLFAYFELRREEWDAAP